MIELAIAAMAIAAIAVVAYPVVRASLGSETLEGTGASVSAEGSPDLANLTAQRDALYRAVKEIDFEYALGSLSVDDYRDLRERYKAKTLGVLKAIHDYQAAAPTVVAETENRPVDDLALDAVVEAAVLRRRGQTRTAASRRLCKECGLQYAAENNFCPNCGRPLTRACVSCGEPYGLDDQYCARCGASVSKTGIIDARRPTASSRR